MESTGGSSTYWRILGSTGGSTHKFRIYDQTNGGDRLNIDGNEQVTKPAQASFAAYRNADAYSLNGATIITYNMIDAVLMIDSCFDHIIGTYWQRSYRTTTFSGLKAHP